MVNNRLLIHGLDHSRPLFNPKYKRSLDGATLLSDLICLAHTEESDKTKKLINNISKELIRAGADLHFCREDGVSVLSSILLTENYKIAKFIIKNKDQIDGLSLEILESLKELVNEQIVE